MQGWLLDWIGRVQEKERAMCLMTLYQLWLARNDARESAQIEDPNIMANRSRFLLEEWQAVRSMGLKSVSRQVEHWRPPDNTWQKANLDGSFKQGSEGGGGGVVIRDHHGNFVVGSCCFFPYASDPEGAELLACREADPSSESWCW